MYRGQTLEIEVSFSKAITVSGSPVLHVMTSKGPRAFTYMGGSESSALRFAYTLVNGDQDLSGPVATFPIDLNGGSIVASGNKKPILLDYIPTVLSSVTLDAMPAEVSSIDYPPDGTYGAGNNLELTLHLTHPVTVVGTPVISLLVGASTVSAAYVSGSGSTTLQFRYEVQAGDQDLTGLDIHFPIVNPPGTSIAPTHNRLLNFPSFTFAINRAQVLIDSASATVVSVSPPINSTYKLGEQLDFSVTYSHPITVTGAPLLPLVVGATSAQAGYVSGSGTSTLVFRYTVLQDQLDLDGVSVDFPILLNGGAMTTPLRPVALASTDATYAGVLVDAEKLAVLSLAPPANSTYVLNNQLNFTVTFSHPATVTGTPRLPLVIGSTTVYADYVSGSVTSSLLFRYTVPGNNYDSDGIRVEFPIDPSGGSITNTTRLTNYDFTDAALSGVLVDSRDLVISSITPPLNDTYDPGELLSFTLNMSQAATVTGSPFIPLIIGSTTVNAVYVSGSGTGSLVFGYTVLSGQSDSNGVSLDFPLNLNGGTVTAPGRNTDLAYTDETFTGVKVQSPFSLPWAFNSTDPTLYNCVAPLFELVGGVCRLFTPDQTDDDVTCSGFGDGTGPTCGGSFTGVTWGEGNTRNPSYTPHEVLRLNTSTNLAELDESWTPRWTNLIAYWKFDGTWNESISGLTTTPQNGPVFDVPGKIGTSSVNFNTNSSAAVSTSTEWRPSYLTISLWSKMTSTNYACSRGLLMLQDGSPFIGLFSCGGNLAFEIQVGSTGNMAHAPQMPLNEWVHHVATYDGVRQRLYRNGNLIVDSALAIGPLTYIPNWTVGIGQRSGTSFNGMIDDLAIWSTALSPAEVAVLHTHQSSKYSGTFLSRVMDGMGTSADWTIFSWIPSLPFFKAAPDAACSPGPTCVHANSESSTDYSSLVGSTGSLGDNNLMTGILGVWHLDDSLGSTSIIDSSGNGNHCTPSGVVTLQSQGKLGASMKYDDINGRLDCGVASVTANDVTTAGWIYETTRVANSDPAYAHPVFANSTGPGYNILSSNNGVLYIVEGNLFQSTGYILPLNTWTHFALRVKSNNSIQLYINGAQVYSRSTGNNLISILPLRIGAWASAFNGFIDEISIWNRPLHPSEIHQLYRRGANRIKFQVRVCIAADCSEPGAKDKWQGPDGSKFSYFSELNNIDPSGAVKKGLPSLALSSFTNPVGISRYFQYRAILESDDTGTGCNYVNAADPLQDTWCSPELKSVKVGPDRYNTTSPSVTGTVGSSFTTLASLAQTLGSGGCASGVSYNLGIGGTVASAVWYWWDPAANSSAGGWVAAPTIENVLQSNPAAVISTNLSSFSAQIGVGTVYFKAFFSSTGSSQCELDQLILQGTR